MIPLSVLDLAPITTGGDAAAALRNSLDLAQHAERWGYRRYWVAEHHNMPGIASAATASSSRTSRRAPRRSGSARAASCCPTMRRSWSPSSSARSNRCFPDGSISASAVRRAPIRRPPARCGATLQAIRMHFRRTSSSCCRTSTRGRTGRSRRARRRLDVPIWILGSSLFGAQVAAMMGLPFAFASHFAAAQMMQAMAITAHASVRLRDSRSRTSCSASTSLPPTPTTRRGILRRPAGRRSPAFAVGCRRRFLHRTANSKRKSRRSEECGWRSSSQSRWWIRRDRARRPPRLHRAHAGGRIGHRVAHLRSCRAAEARDQITAGIVATDANLVEPGRT